MLLTGELSWASLARDTALSNRIILVSMFHCMQGRLSWRH